jgi:hypothetical protein
MVLPVEAILSKSADMVVGGVASNFFRDLDGDAICPDAIQRAIPGFMATRGPDGLKGGPIRLHHGFWERFLKQSISALNIPYDQQVGLLAAIALPLGRVTEMSVDSDGTTRWRGVLSGANPIARVVWNMLKEGMVHLGVSVGGKINGVRPGRDAIGRTCNLITDVRLDELSITDNPANRLIESETPDNGAYITALAKSVGNTMLAQKQQHYIYLNGIAYTAHPSEEHGIVLRKAGRRRAPSPGQLGLFGGHNEGDTKVEDGVTYRLNSNSRWERMDKPKASGKPSGGKMKAEKPAIVPVVEDEPASQDPEPTVSDMLEQQQAAIADEPMPEEYSEAGITPSEYKAIQKYEARRDKFVSDHLKHLNSSKPEYLEEKQYLERLFLDKELAREEKKKGFSWDKWERTHPPTDRVARRHWLGKLEGEVYEKQKKRRSLEPAAQDPEPTVSEMLEQQQAAIADKPMPEGEAMEGAEDGAAPTWEDVPQLFESGDYEKIPQALGVDPRYGLSPSQASRFLNILGIKEAKAKKILGQGYLEQERKEYPSIQPDPKPHYELDKLVDAINEAKAFKGVKALQKPKAERPKRELKEEELTLTDNDWKRLAKLKGASAFNVGTETRYWVPGHAIKDAEYLKRKLGFSIKKGSSIKGANFVVQEDTLDNVFGYFIKPKSAPTLTKSLTPSFPMTIDNFLRKALGNPGREFGSGSWRDTGIPAMGRKVDAKSPQPKGGKKVQMDESASAHAGKGIGGKQPKAHRPYSSGGMPPTDVFGITITQLTRNLAKACYMDKDAWGSPETVSFLTDSARAIAGMTDTPTDPMVNFVRFLQYCTRFAQELPFMNDYQAAGTVKAMNADLTKALDEFVEKMPEELKGKPLRPAGSPGVVGIDVQFPQQYVIYS